MSIFGGWVYKLAQIWMIWGPIFGNFQLLLKSVKCPSFLPHVLRFSRTKSPTLRWKRYESMSRSPRLLRRFMLEGNWCLQRSHDFETWGFNKRKQGRLTWINQGIFPPEIWDCSNWFGNSKTLITDMIGRPENVQNRSIPFSDATIVIDSWGH